MKPNAINLLDKVRFICRCGAFVWSTSLLLCVAMQSAQASQDRFGGVFHEGTDPHNLEAGLSWDQLVDKMTVLGNRDQKLIDVEIIQRQSARLDRCQPPTFAGVWRSGHYGQSIIGGLDWHEFKKQIKAQQRRYGMRLIDIETHVECGIRKYVGILAEGTAHQHVKSQMTWNAFAERYSSLHEDGWHLVDIETYLDKGTRYWAAIWDKGYKDEWLWILPRREFEDLQEFVDGSLQLVDMESWREGGSQDGNRMIAGLFNQSPKTAFMETGENWPKFLSLWTELSGLPGDELRLVDLEVYPDTTDYRWANTFYQVLNDKAMGWSFAVMESGQLAAAGAEGWARSPYELFNPSMPMEAASVMNVASVTKMLTVVGILKLSEINGGPWLLDVPVAAFLHPYYDTSTFGDGVDTVTLRHLMTQKTCMHEIDLAPLGTNYLDRIGEWLKLPLKDGCLPGTGDPTYYNHYFNLLVLVVEAATLQDYETWMNQHVFSPVGIGPLACGPATYFNDPLYYKELPDSSFGIRLDLPGTNCFNGPDEMGGAWYASSVDMARFVSSFRDGTVISPASVQMMESEVMAWYWNSHALYPEINGQKNGGLRFNGRGMGTDVMAFEDDLDVSIIFNSGADVSAEEDLILPAYYAPEDW